MSFFYEDILRLDWGFGNPNRTAALIAMLMIVSWLPAYWKRWAFWLSLILFTGLGLCLVQTFSRGGMLALFCGVIPLVLLAPRPWPRSRILALALSVLFLVGYAVSLSATDRVADSWQGDRSVTNRLELWKHVPAMIADAPGGWGWGQAQSAYMNWYQPVDRTERFLNLTSVHFNVLVEVSWLLRWLYLAGWLFVLHLAWPRPGTPPNGIPLGILVVFLVAGQFTHFGDSWPVYAPPILAALYLLVTRIRIGASRLLRPALVAGALTIVCCGLLYVVGRISSKLSIHGGRETVVVGHGVPSAWILVDRNVMGDHFGKVFRRHLPQQGSNAPSVGFTLRASALPTRANRIAFGNPAPDDLRALAEKQPKALVFLNSRLYPLEVQHIFGAAPVASYFGEFSRASSQSAWSETPGYHSIPGAGDFLPNWPQVLFAPPVQQ